MGGNLRAWWQLKPRHERRLLALLALVVAAVAAWLLVVDPVERETARLRALQGDLQRRLAVAQHDADEAARLARVALPAPGDARAALDSALGKSGLRASLTSLEWRDRSARLTFASVAFADLVAWLERVQLEAGLSVREATLSGLVEPGRVRAELVLAR